MPQSDPPIKSILLLLGFRDQGHGARNDRLQLWDANFTEVHVIHAGASMASVEEFLENSNQLDNCLCPSVRISFQFAGWLPTKNRPPPFR
eukprot:scaffold3234_cov166-Amphora_coffeaeformis.AAC.15